MSEEHARPGPAKLPGNPRYVIGGRVYPFVDAGDVDLWAFADIYDETGITPERLEELTAEIAEAGKEGSRFSDMGWLASRDHVTAVAVQVWLARRAVGESLTIREASMVPVNELAIVTDGPGAGEADEADPTPDGAQLGGVPSDGSGE